jgi:methyl-accepting chemotaxis protein
MPMFNRVSNAKTTPVEFVLKKNTATLMSDEQLFNEAVCNLRQAVLSQGKSHRRVATRVRFLIRSIMFGLVSSLLFILFLIVLLTHQVNVLTTSLNNISTNTSSLLDSINDIELDVLQFETAMAVMPNISTSVIGMNQNVSSLTTRMGSVTKNVKKIKGELQLLHGSLADLSKNTQVLEQSVGNINKDMNEVTKPMKRFNDFNPFN